MNRLPTYASTPSTRCHLQVEPHHDCPEWSAFYDCRHGGILCSCALEEGHSCQHECVCGFCWGAGSAPTVTLPDAEMLAGMDELKVWTFLQN